MSFHTGFLVKWDLQTVRLLDGPTIARLYATHGGFIIDALAFIPAVVQLALYYTETEAKVAQVLLLMKLLRLLRVVRLMAVRLFIYLFSNYLTYIAQRQ